MFAVRKTPFLLRRGHKAVVLTSVGRSVRPTVANCRLLPPPNPIQAAVRYESSSSGNNGFILGELGTLPTGGVLLPSSRPARRGRRSIDTLLQQLKPNAILPVSAVHAAQTIDLGQLMSPTFANSSVKRKMFGKNSIVIRLTEETTNTAPRYVAVFRFGSIVYFNLTAAEAATITDDIKKFASEPVLKGAERRENFGVLVTRDLDTSAMLVEQAFEPVTGDYCMVPELDMNGVAVISTIMAQTVALDSYSDTVEALLTNFAKINSTVTKTGNFTSTDKNFLFKTVAQNNSIFIDMISKVRIKDRSDTAWNMTKYETIHYGLKEEFVRFIGWGRRFIHVQLV